MFAILGLLNVVNGDVLTAATLSALAVLAFAVIRERSSRESFVSAAAMVPEALRRIEQSVSSLRTGTPYRATRYEVHWEIVTADEKLAVGRKRKRLRFLQNNVLSLSDFVQAEGRVSKTTYSAGVKRVDSFRAGARSYDLLSLGRLMQADDEMDFMVEREVQNSFPADNESVTVEVLDPTDVVVIKVTWPKDRPPRNTRLEQIIEQRTTSRDIASGELQRRDDGRIDFSTTIDDPPLGSAFTVFWDW